MSREFDNYPDDIRQYDDDPRSPFYVDPNEWQIEEADKLAALWLKEYETFGDLTRQFGWTIADIEAEKKERKFDDLFEMLTVIAAEEIERNPESYIPYDPDLNWD